ncbi:hypothetical protein [Embleya hyalina]|uniref:Uncharacterized protein n=1 Tax=Embleya hyalina TaxID=516124 RepID=A0A401Z1I1_9ACTN|nr:hypothetical protein [Embleya hyalina]GCE00626.1 hypothetical protein EHYA_08352 [Embleya hyalina]
MAEPESESFLEVVTLTWQGVVVPEWCVGSALSHPGPADAATLTPPVVSPTAWTNRGGVPADAGRLFVAGEWVSSAGMVVEEMSAKAGACTLLRMFGRAGFARLPKRVVLR